MWNFAAVLAIRSKLWSLKNIIPYWINRWKRYQRHKKALPAGVSQTDKGRINVFECLFLLFLDCNHNLIDNKPKEKVTIQTKLPGEPDDMSWKTVIEDFANDAGITEHLKKQIIRLTGYLEQIVDLEKDTQLPDLVARLPKDAAAAFNDNDKEVLDKLKEEFSGLTLSTLTRILRLYTVFFHLVNSMEQHEITRINRKRAREIREYSRSGLFFKGTGVIL